MKIKILKFIALLFVFAGGFSFCNKNTLDDSNIDMSNIDFSNIEDLHAQPLPVIQKCVEGKWQWIETDTWGVVGIFRPSNTFINITNNRVDVIKDDSLNEVFSYSWEKKKTIYGYTTYVMKERGWFFDNIRNDSLRVLSSVAYFMGNGDSYLFLRIK